MATAKRIGLNLFFDNHSNSGVVNYIYNIVAALHTLPEADQPIVVLLHSSNAPVAYIQSTGYKKLVPMLFSEQPSRPPLKKINQLLLNITGKNFYKQWKFYRKFDVMYPYFEMMKQPFADFGNKIHWLVDFNNLAFPEHYADGGSVMKTYQDNLVKRTEKIVLSSNTLKDELARYFPDYKNDVSVLRFASTLQIPSSVDVKNIKAKAGVGDAVYFMSPNQFWEHKNQIVVFEALRLLKQRVSPKPFKIVFTGSLDVNRGKGKFALFLQEKIKDYGLDEFIIFTGVLDRTEQLVLMQHSLALLQPSLYEGWSTLVEEAKALNKFIILSDLPVHREQLNKNVAFFSPHDAEQLASLMEKELVAPTPVEPMNYKTNIEQFSKDILAILQ